MDPRALIAFRNAYTALQDVQAAGLPLSARDALALAQLQSVGRIHVVRLAAYHDQMAPKASGLGAWYDSLNDFVGGVESGAAQEWGAVQAGAQDAWSWVKNEASSLASDATEPVRNVYHAAQQGVSNTIDHASRAVGGAVRDISNAIDQNITQPVANWTRNTQGFLSHLGQQFGAGISSVYGASQNIANASTWIGGGLVILAGVIFLRWVLE